MSALTDLISQIENPELRARIQAEIDRANKQKKFGLVFEEHLPESTPLYDVPIKVGRFVSTREKSNDGFVLMKVISIEDGMATCVTQAKETISYPIDDLVTVAPFGEPIYPYLKPLDSICNAPDSNLWHTLIEADNYHALQLLEYLYAGKVDCIYIDPPYNTGARDWKYNNDYVDSSDTYRHSKWLSMMQKRLKLAKKLLNPKDSVLIVTIDEKEYLHLGCLLEELFSEASIQMVTDVTSPRAGASRNNEFSRSEEYIFFVRLGDAGVGHYNLTGVTDEGKKDNSPIWFSLLRTGNNSSRKNRPRLFYPIWITPEGKLHSIGEFIPTETDIKDIIPPANDLICLLPTRPNGEQNTWNCSSTTLKEWFEKGTARIRNNGGRFVVSYLRNAEKQRIENGELELYGRDIDGSWLVRKKENSKRITTTKSVWITPAHDAGINGSMLIKSILSQKRFDFPKSLYSVADSLRFFVGDKPNALVIDFFAGSGTTLHAVNLLNAEDGGNRRCIMVTNNEVSDEESKALKAKGFKPGDKEWDNLGIARYVTWPRTKCSILGIDINGKPLKGEYITTSDEKKTFSSGFKTNAAFFKLGFLDKTSIALGKQFKELLPVLWMKAGAIGPCPKVEEDILPEWLILTQNKMAILLDETAFPAFEELMREQPDIRTLYLVTDSEKEFVAMSAALGIKDSYQIYRDYLDNFRINRNR